MTHEHHWDRMTMKDGTILVTCRKCGARKDEPTLWRESK